MKVKGVMDSFASLQRVSINLIKIKKGGQGGKKYKRQLGD
jgi:hypothetical protein